MVAVDQQYLATGFGGMAATYAICGSKKEIDKV